MDLFFLWNYHFPKHGLTDRFTPSIYSYQLVCRHKNCCVEAIAVRKDGKQQQLFPTYLQFSTPYCALNYAHTTHQKRLRTFESYSYRKKQIRIAFIRHICEPISAGDSSLNDSAKLNRFLLQVAPSALQPYRRHVGRQINRTLMTIFRPDWSEHYSVNQVLKLRLDHL